MTLDVDRDSADAAQDTLVTPSALPADPAGVPAVLAVPPGRIRVWCAMQRHRRCQGRQGQPGRTPTLGLPTPPPPHPWWRDAALVSGRIPPSA